MAIVTQYQYTISTDTLNGKVSTLSLVKAISSNQNIPINLSAKKAYISASDELTIEFLDALPGTIKVDELDTLVAAHDGVNPSKYLDKVILDSKTNKDGVPAFQQAKSYHDSSKSFTTPDYSNRQTWWYDTTAVIGEVLTGDANFLVYTSQRVPQAGWNPDWIIWTKIPNNARQEKPELRAKVYVDGTQVTTGFSIDHAMGTVTFNAPLVSSNVVTVDYHYANSADFVLTPTAGKKLLVDYVETQFSAGCGKIPEGCYIQFQAIYNGPAVPALGIPANYDIVLKNYEYHTGADFMNESTQAFVCEPFMELTQKQNILPWNYLTGYTLKPSGDVTTDIFKNEFNKLKCTMEGNGIIPNCEIATGTFYCMVEDIV